MAPVPSAHENSRSAADVVARSQEKFQLANHSLEETVLAVDEINSQSGKISRIIKVIDEIAFQTNILALNATVEAARAGEAGMGFAVVADEVRNLAQRCAQAARDTSSLIEESIVKATGGKTRVDEVAAAIRAITEESGSIKTLVDEVNLGSQEQTRGLEQIARAITQMEQVTQRTAANAEESAAAAEQLNAQSVALKQIVNRLTVMVGRDKSRSAGRPLAPPPGPPAAPRLLPSLVQMTLSSPSMPPRPGPGLRPRRPPAHTSPALPAPPTISATSSFAGFQSSVVSARLSPSLTTDD